MPELNVIVAAGLYTDDSGLWFFRHRGPALCDSAGVDPGRVVLGPSGYTTDCDHLADLADAGFMRSVCYLVTPGDPVLVSATY